MNRTARRVGWAAVIAGTIFAHARAGTYVVNQRHAAASDDNPGTAAAPLKTIGAAAGLGKAGDTVIIRGGVYRESVTVSPSGNAEAPIRFQAAPGERVVVTGADLITKWEKVEGDGRILRTPWPHRFIGWHQSCAHPDDDYHRMIGRAEQVFVHGYLLHQVLSREQLSRGTFHVDLAEKCLYVWSRDNSDLTAGRVPVEASVRPVIWVNEGAWVWLKGLRFRYCANAAQKGAVQVRGHHNRVEDCLFERANSIGAQFGGREAQGIVVRRCVFQHNGQMGFSAVRAHGLVMTGCIVRDNNTKGWNRGWEAGANKIVLCRGLLIEKSTFLGNAGHGIWFDIGNEDCEVRNCLIADNDNAGIFYEISYGLHAHDNVIVGNGFNGSTGAWGADGGISISSSPGCRVERNLIVGNKEGLQFREQTRSTPRITDGKDRKGHAVWNHDHAIRSNLIALNSKWQVGGWFDVLDGRHWPKALQSGWETGGKGPPADIAAQYKARGQPMNVSLEELNIRIEGNVYWAEPPQGLYLWGCTWRRHKAYSDLDAVRKELKLEAGSRTAGPAFADFAARDLRLPPGHPALSMKCYPTGDVPGVRLGTIE
ncbi:MAG: right-handed parallel beta-helix repeat-containing protein [Phycisphaerae bacterium]